MPNQNPYPYSKEVADYIVSSERGNLDVGGAGIEGLVEDVLRSPEAVDALYRAGVANGEIGGAKDQGEMVAWMIRSNSGVPSGVRKAIGLGSADIVYDAAEESVAEDDAVESVEGVAEEAAEAVA